MTFSLADTHTEILSRIKAARAQALTPAESTTLVAVSKGHPAARMEEALALGQHVFGENRVQEAQEKWPALKAKHPEIELHLIGPLQSNKAKEAVALFDVIETVDRPKLAEALAAEMARQNRHLPCFIQVNTGEEAQKAGVLPDDVDDFIRECREKWKLPVVGLMCIPPAETNPAPHFALLREIAKRHGLSQLSMGMSGDFEVAVRFGATHVRVGTALFGERN